MQITSTRKTIAVAVVFAALSGLSSIGNANLQNVNFQNADLTEANLKITNQGNNANSHLYSAGEVRFDNGPGSRTFENIGKEEIRSIQFELK